MEQVQLVCGTQEYITESDLSEQFKNGKIGFNLNGQKLRGRFTWLEQALKINGSC
jgi:hypothetical protein